MGVNASRRVVLGRIAGAYGVRGWVRVESWTRPPRNLLEYSRWQLGHSGHWREVTCLNGRPHGRGLVAQLAGEGGAVLDGRDEATGLAGSEIAVYRHQMPSIGPDEYYWVDLEGLEVEDLEGRVMGRIRELFETPAHDVMVIQGERERLIPFVRETVVKSVDLDTGRIRVDWPDPVE